MADSPKPRAKRSPLPQTEPERGQWAAGTGAAAAAPAPAAPAPASAAAPAGVEHAVAQAVRIGYDVIGKNLEQARAAADRIGAGQYKVRDVPDDMAQLGARLMTAVREAGSAWIDVVSAAMRDPALRDALRPRAAAPAAGAASATGPATAPKPAQEDLDPGAPLGIFIGAVYTPAPEVLPVSVTVTGAAASGSATRMMRPETPSALHCPGLFAAGAAPPLRDLVFGADADGLTVAVTVPAGTAAGSYAGQIFDAESTPLATLTVVVA